MITLETVIAFALRDPIVMDQLGPALRNDLVTANPFYRQLVTFADDFLLKHAKLPLAGDWDFWLESLTAGAQRDGCRDALGRLQLVDLREFTAEFFTEQAVAQLQHAAAQVAKARLNELQQVALPVFLAMAEKLESIQGGGLKGLARLDDVDTWARPVREDDLLSTGYHGLDRLIGGWGKELWIAFADSGVGKSMLLQNFSTNAALKGKRVLHLTLELGIGPQIRRYYRQIAQITQGDFARDEAEAKRRLRHWFRMATGEVLLLEFPAYGVTTDDLQRLLTRVSRIHGQVDVLTLDYLDLLGVGKNGRNAYEDLGRLTHEVRALCGKFGLTVLTASQAVRRPARADRLTMRDMGDSYNKVRGADGLLSLVQTDEEAEVHQGRLGVLKVRDSGGRGKEIALYVNRELAVIQELDHPNTVELMRRLGHLPGGVAVVPPRTGGVIA